MNLTKTQTLENALAKNYPVYIVYNSETKELLNWFPFGEKMAKMDAEDRCAKSGPDTHDYAEWSSYAKIRERHAEQMADINAEWRKR